MKQDWYSDRGWAFGQLSGQCRRLQTSYKEEQTIPDLRLIKPHVQPSPFLSSYLLPSVTLASLPTIARLPTSPSTSVLSERQQLHADFSLALTLAKLQSAEPGGGHQQNSSVDTVTSYHPILCLYPSPSIVYFSDINIIE